MSMLKVSVAIVFAGAVAGIAFAAPTPRENFGVGPSNGAPQLDRAAVFRPAHVGECAAPVRRQVTEPQTRERHAKRAPAERRVQVAVGCSVVWSD